ncbi:MAG: hypothetical protein WBM35_11375 [Candidatus Electrothrix sp.]
MRKIAGIYWDTSSVGGIATEAETFRRIAAESGDLLHVLRSPCAVSKAPILYPEPKLIRGGDTFIYIDGEISHHPNQVEASIDFLHENYDGLLFIFPCPHATKAYGNEPHFLPFYTDTWLPKVMRILDAYWSTYAEWGELCAAECNTIFVNQPAYAEPLKGSPLYDKIVLTKKPFLPFKNDLFVDRNTDLLIWPNQWKAIKGIKPFLKTIPLLPEWMQIEMYSNGIEYYQQRQGVDWLMAVRWDHFKGFDGLGRADFYGYVTLTEMAKAYARATWTVDFQGHAVKYEAYKQGSYNNTTVEALYYGALPILDFQATKSPVPNDLFYTVDSPLGLPDLDWLRLREKACDPGRRAKAREWVLDFHSAAKVWKTTMEGMFE